MALLFDLLPPGTIVENTLELIRDYIPPNQGDVKNRIPFQRGFNQQRFKRHETVPKDKETYPYPYVFINIEGKEAWHTHHPIQVIEMIRKLRRSSMISPYVSVHMDRNTIYIRTSGGRNMRLVGILKPFVAYLKKNKLETATVQSPIDLRKTSYGNFLDFFSEQWVEWLDLYEERTILTCQSFDDFVERASYDSGNGEPFSHFELEPSWIVDIVAGFSQFMHMNQMTRAVLNSAMLTAAPNIVPNPYKNDNFTYGLEHAQRRLLQTRLERDYDLSGLYISYQLPVTIMADPYATEDGTSQNKAMLERGGMRIYMTRTHTVKINTSAKNSKIERIEKPDERCVGRQMADFSKITKDGLPVIGEYYSHGTALVGVTTQEKDMTVNQRKMDSILGDQLEMGLEATSSSSLNTNEMIYDPENTVGISKKRDNSIILRDEMGFVEEIRDRYSHANHLRHLTISVRIPHVTEEGDKAQISSHGQKGVICMIENCVDRPFSSQTGNSAGFIIGPAGIIGRNTPAVCHQMLVSKGSVMNGKKYEATAFRNRQIQHNLQESIQTLHQKGYHQYGYERFYCGKTGKRIQRPLFTAITDVNPLCHLVSKKNYARDKGAMKESTRQAVDGRKNAGGLRLGGMELENLIAIGACCINNSKLKKHADLWILFICRRCGTMAIGNDTLVSLMHRNDLCRFSLRP